LKAGLKTIVAARQTTFYQQYDETVSFPADRAAYCGASPLDVVNVRLGAFLKNPGPFCGPMDPSTLPRIVPVGKAIERLLGHKSFKEFLADLCGLSVRHGLLLAQRLLNNSVFDPLGQDKLELTISDLKRAVLCGTDATFEWSRASCLENVFQVHESARSSYLIKLRLLTLARARDGGERLGTLIDTLQGFGYDLRLVCDALNELMLKTKRLLWNDTVEEFRGPEDLLVHRRSLTSVSTRGLGYVRRTFTRVEYIQEVMLDTRVEADRVGRGWRYSERDERLALLQAFVRLIFEEDLREVNTFLDKRGAAEYVRSFGGGWLPSADMLRGLKGDIGRILSGEQSQFAVDHMKGYEDLLIRAENFEAKLERMVHRRDAAEESSGKW
jgi:hypothetical protein